MLSVCYSQDVFGWHCFSTKSTMLRYLVWMRFIWWCPCAVTTRSNSCRARRMSSPPPRAIVRWSLVPGLFQTNQGAIWFTPRLGQLCPEQHSGRASQSACVRCEPQPLSTSYDRLEDVFGLISKVFHWSMNEKTGGGLVNSLLNDNMKLKPLTSRNLPGLTKKCRHLIRHHLTSIVPFCLKPDTKLIFVQMLI